MASPAPAVLVFGKGIQIMRGDTPEIGATAFSLIPHFRGTISGPGGSSDIRDVTVHELITPASRVRQKAPGLSDAGSLDGTIFFDPDHPIHKGVLEDWKTGTFRDYQMVLPPGVTTQYKFRAGVGNFRQQYPIDDYAVCDLSFVFLSIDFEGTAP